MISLGFRIFCTTIAVLFFFESAFSTAFIGDTQSSELHKNSYGGAFGYQTDDDSGLMLLGHRYYDSSTGRFLSRDPIGDGSNWYGYCKNNPLKYFDNQGKKPSKCEVHPEPKEEKWPEIAMYFGTGVAGIGAAIALRFPHVGIPIAAGGAVIAGVGAFYRLGQELADLFIPLDTDNVCPWCQPKYSEHDLNQRGIYKENLVDPVHDTRQPASFGSREPWHEIESTKGRELSWYLQNYID